MENVTELFIKLASIQSPSGQEKAIGKILKRSLQSLCDSIYEDRAGNLFAKKAGTGKPLLLCAHMDTVNPVSSDLPKLSKGVIHASGTGVLGADDKSAVAAILVALHTLKNKQHRPLEVLITVREETDAGIRDFPRHMINAKEALLSDIARPMGGVVTAAPYVFGYGITVRAPGGHVGLTTTDTIHPLRFLQEFMGHMKYGRVRKDSIHNIAIVHMGKSYNSVPQDMQFTGEIRTFSDRFYRKFTSELKPFVKKIDKKLHTKSEVTIYPYCKGYILDTSEVKRIRSVMKECGVDYRPLEVFSVGDFNILKEWGITPINIATGGKDAHTTYESISVRSLNTLVEIFSRYIISL